MDPLSDVIALLRPHALVWKPITGRGAWGVRYAAYDQPGFGIVLDGTCWLALEDGPPVRLDAGDFVLLPAAPAFTLRSESGASVAEGRPSAEAVRHGDPGGEPDVRMLGGTFRIEAVNAALLVALLPRMIHVRAAGGGTRRLAGIVDLIRDECGEDRPGHDMILERLLEVLLVEALRGDGALAAVPGGLLAGLCDPGLSAALRAMHGAVRTGWTVADLAARAGMSRSAFAARFTAIVGCAPMEYLARWRMALARDALSRGGISLDRIAEEVGYESASAFSTAFRRRVGSAPGSFARSQRGLRSAA
ncbi:MAG: AraC family transcriptional regulator [Bauldia sp.]|nr:AraC family transcriptional regulator [Bauldia sp.]